MAILDDIRNFLGGKKVVSPIPQTQQPSFGQNLLRQVGNVAPPVAAYNSLQENIPKVQNAISNFATNHPTLASFALKAEPIYNTVQNTVRSIPEKPLNLQLFRDQVSNNGIKTGNDIFNKVANAPINIAANVGTGIVEGIVNAPTQMVYNAYRFPQAKTLPQALGNTAGIVEPLFSMATPKQIPKLLDEATTQPEFLTQGRKLIAAIKEGLSSGAQFGGTFGALQGMQQNADAATVPEQILKSVPSTITGAAAGGVIGAGTAGAGQVIRSSVEAIQGQARTQAKDMADRLLRQAQNKRPKWAKGKSPQQIEDYLYDYYKRTIGQGGFVDVSGGTDQSGLLQRDKKALGIEGELPESRLAIEQPQVTKPIGQSEVSPSNLTRSGEMPQLNTQLETGLQTASGESLTPAVRTTQESGLQTDQLTRMSELKDPQPLQSIIDEGRSQIKQGSYKEDKRSVKQVFNDAYTQWVDRFNPVVQASKKAKETLKSQGAVLRPENDPEYLVRRLTGAGGIADARFQNELKPVLDQVDKLKIDKLDLDTYLANKRIAGFGAVGRDIYGADPVKAQQIIGALESKYGKSISEIADKLYQYQNQGFQDMVDAGFISKESAQTIKSQNPDYSPLYRAMDEVSNYLGLPTRKTMQGSQPIKQIKGSDKQILSPLESIIGNTFSQRAAIEKNRVAKSIVDLQKVAPDLGFEKVSASGNDTITIWNNGQKEFWKVGNDIADVAKGVNEEAMNMVLKILQKPASILRQSATGRNPEFIIPNMIRDQLDAGISSKYGYIPFVDYLSGLKSMLNNDEIYQKWEQSGANIDLGEISGRKSISKMFEEKTAKKGLASWITSVLDTAGQISEQPTRVGLFKKAYKATGNELIAMMESRDSTLDFARMGSKMKVANSIIPFLNVGVQGFDKLIRSAKNNPGKVAFMMGLYGTLPQLATQINNLQNHPQEYAEIPQYVKDNNFVIIRGRNEKGTVDYFTIPKGNITPIASNPVQSFVDYLYKVDNQSFAQMATSLFSETLPVLSPGSTPKEVALKTIGSNIPQAVKPAAEALLNKSFFKYDSKNEQAKEIVPNYLQKKAPYEQAYEFTPVMYKKIGAVLNVSPLIVQNTLEGYFSSYAKIPAQITEIVSKISRGDEVNPNDRTIFRRFFQQTYPSSSSSTPNTPQTPPLMERVLGKASAAEEANPLSDVLKEKELKTKAMKDYKEYLTGKKKLSNPEDYFKKTYNTTTEELNKQAVKSLNTQDQAVQVYDLMKSEKFSQAKFTEFVNQGLLTDAIAKEFYDTGKVNKGQYDALRIAIKEAKTGKPATKRTSGGKKVSKAELKSLYTKVNKPITYKKPSARVASVKLLEARKLPTLMFKGKPLTFKKKKLSL